MILTTEDASTSYEQVKVLSRAENNHYRDCVGSLIYILCTRDDLCSAVHKTANIS